MSILARIDTASLSVGSRTLPAPTADAAPVQVDVNDPRVGPVRITYEIMQHKRGRNAHVFWIAVDAVQIDSDATCVSPPEIDTSSTHLGHVQSYASPSFTLAVCGGRDFDDEEWAFRCLDRVHAKRPITMLIEGGARGADTIARLWAESRNVPFLEFKADWERYRRSAGPRRNAQMVAHGLDGLVAFPGGSGTADMMRQCREAGVTVWEPGHDNRTHAHNR